MLYAVTESVVPAHCCIVNAFVHFKYFLLIQTLPEIEYRNISVPSSKRLTYALYKPILQC